MPENIVPVESPPSIPATPGNNGQGKYEVSIPDNYDLNESGSITQTKLTDYQHLLEAARVRPTDTIEADPAILWIKAEPNPVQFGTLGNFSVISGKAKSRKSFLLCLIVAAAIDGSQFTAGPFICTLPFNKRRVLYFDTEQGRYRVLKFLKRACKLAGVDDPHNLEYYDLRAHTPKERVGIINHAINDGNPQKDIGLVVIDGCRDLIYNFNDPDESMRVTTQFMQWTAENNLHIVTVSHQNKGDDNIRGHFGAEMTNKAESVLAVEKDRQDKSISTVNPAELRDIDFNGFAFTVNAEGLPELLPDYEIGGKTPASKKSSNLFDYPPEAHHNVLSRVFEGENDGLAYKELQSRLSVEWAANGQKISNQTTQDLITYYHHKMKWITHNMKSGKAAKYSYKLH